MHKNRTPFHSTRPVALGLALCAALASFLVAAPATGQSLVVTPEQKSRADQVAQAGVALAELADNAPDSYTVKAGDTLWAISGLFLKSPWRWPDLWGMNLQDIRNPHRIYPGQQLYLLKKDGRAVLSTRQAATPAPEEEQIPTVRISPSTRYESLAGSALPTLNPNSIEPFLAEPVIVEEGALLQAPRIVATQEGRVLLSRGDRGYVRSAGGPPLVTGPGKFPEYRVFRNATALKDPSTGAILGYEAQFVGRAVLVRDEAIRTTTGPGDKVQTEIIPATIDIIRSKEEMRTGDRLLPEPPREFVSYVPRSPGRNISGQIVSVYGSAVMHAAQNQVVVINRGTADGLESGHVLAILKDGPRVLDRTGSEKTEIKLPDERDGLLMVFKPYERLSYALVLEISDGVKIGDRLVNPR